MKSMKILRRGNIYTVCSLLILLPITGFGQNKNDSYEIQGSRISISVPANYQPFLHIEGPTEMTQNQNGKQITATITYAKAITISMPNGVEIRAENVGLTTTETNKHKTKQFILTPAQPSNSPK